ncbi:MAG: iron chelate uptake ABC transporter family permease subunit [Pseudomonadota bacterium]
MVDCSLRTIGFAPRSLTVGAVRMIDPNEHSVLQLASYARFNQIETDLLALAARLIGLTLPMLWRMRHRLDNFALGREAAINLGEDPRRGTLEVLALIPVLVAVSTACVGPVAFMDLFA